MGKRFTEYSQFDLSQVNKDVLKKWPMCWIPRIGKNI